MSGFDDPVRYPRGQKPRRRNPFAFIAPRLGATVAVYTIVISLVFGLGWLSAKIDSSLNSWLPRNGFRWSMIFSQHFETLLWLNAPHTWVLVNVIVGAVIASLISIYLWLH